jgi:hypothetical protein
LVVKVLILILQVTIDLVSPDKDKSSILEAWPIAQDTQAAPYWSRQEADPEGYPRL